MSEQVRIVEQGDAEMFLRWRKKLQSARTLEELAAYTHDLVAAFPNRYKPLYDLSLQGEPDIVERQKFLLQHCRGKVLDVGSYDGFFSVALAKSGLQVTGIDMMPVCVEAAKVFAQEQHVAGVDFKIGFAERLPVSADTYDTTVLSHTLEHVFDMEAAVAEAARVTRPGGVIIAIVPIELGIEPTHLRLVEGGELRDLLRCHGDVSEEYVVGEGIGFTCTLPSET